MEFRRLSGELATRRLFSQATVGYMCTTYGGFMKTFTSDTSTEPSLQLTNTVAVRQYFL